MRSAALFVMVSLVAVPAFAQGPYVGASVGMDVSRFTHVEADNFNGLDAGGEVFNFSLRLGTAVGERWGVELGFTRPNELERDSRRGFPIPLLANALAPVGIDIGVAFPIFDSTRSERRNTTIETVAWVAQPAGDRVDLVYLGGLAFNRITEDIRFQFTRRIAGIVVPNSTRTVTYNVGPVAGMDARIELTDHVQLVPGVRLQTLGGNGNQGWLVRTSAGLNWQF